MKSTIIEGIPDSKIKRLKKHLLKVEELAGLRKTPRFLTTSCPIQNFALPMAKKNGYGCVFGFGCQRLHDTLWDNNKWFFSIYSGKDYEWWRNLPVETRIAITRHIQQWIKEGKKL